MYQALFVQGKGSLRAEVPAAVRCGAGGRGGGPGRGTWRPAGGSPG
jgi:hypothetical protein